MKRFVERGDRRQSYLLPQSLDDYVAEDNPVRVVEVFIDELDLGGLGFTGVQAAATGRPAYHPSTSDRHHCRRKRGKSPGAGSWQGLWVVIHTVDGPAD